MKECSRAGHIAHHDAGAAARDVGKVLATIRKDITTGEVRVDNPTQNLESYFLDVVNKARSAQETSGAQSGARVAEYLRGGIEEKPATEKVLERLTLPQVSQPLLKLKCPRLQRPKWMTKNWRRWPRPASRHRNGRTCSRDQACGFIQSR